MTQTDLTLIEKWILHRDAEAFKALTERYAGMVYATCTRILPGRMDAEDATQECFEKLASLKKPPHGRMGAWLHKVATNRSLNRLKGDRRRRAREERFSSERHAKTEIEWTDVYGYVDEAIVSLPPKVRTAVVAHFLGGMTHEAIAQQEGVSRAAVTQRIQRGITDIRKTLGRSGVLLPGAALATLMEENLASACYSAPPQVSASLGKLALSATAGPARTGYGALAVRMTKPKLIVAAVLAGGIVVLGIFLADEPAVPNTTETVLPSYPITIQPETAIQPPVEASSVTSPNATASIDSQSLEGDVTTGTILGTVRFRGNSVEGMAVQLRPGEDQTEVMSDAGGAY